MYSEAVYHSVLFTNSLIIKLACMTTLTGMHSRGTYFLVYFSFNNRQGSGWKSLVFVLIVFCPSPKVTLDGWGDCEQDLVPLARNG